MKRNPCRFVLSIWILIGAAASASGRDLEALSDLLVPAYTAMNYAGVCSMDGTWAISQPVGDRGSAVNYAQHVKDEIVAPLSYAEAVSVLLAAADAARSEARSQLRRNVISADKLAETERLRNWCNGYVDAFINELIRKHDGDHDVFLERMGRAVSSTENTQ